MDALLALTLDAEPQIKDPPKTVPGLVLHVDGDYLAYFASGNDDVEQGQSRLIALDIIASAQRASGAESVVVHNTTSGCDKGERYVIATLKPYQGQRDPGRKPKNYSYLRTFLMGYEGPVFRAKNWSTREADDGIAACAHFAIGQGPGYAAIFTRDKDMQMLPGLHVDWLSRETIKVEPGAFEVLYTPRGKDKVRIYGTKWFWLQMLMGDTADNIPGLESYLTLNAKGAPCIKKMGEVTARDYLSGAKNNDDAYNIVTDLYVNYYQRAGAPEGTWADRFCEQAALLWLRTDNAASVADFARHGGTSKISGLFCDQMWAAVGRLEKRVKDARAKANDLANQGNS